jgi:hypothetical protein
MQVTTMQDMRTQPAIVNISSARARARDRMRDLAAAASAAAAAATDPNGIHPGYPEPPRHGRAWLNGRELGGSDRRYAHLTRAHD